MSNVTSVKPIEPMNTTLIDTHRMTDSDLHLIVALVACLICFLCCRWVFSEHLKIGPPNLIAGAVAALAFLGLGIRGSDQRPPAPLEVNYSTLAIFIVLAVILGGAIRFFRQSKKRRRPADLERHRVNELLIPPLPETDLYRDANRWVRSKAAAEDQPLDIPPSSQDESDQTEAPSRPKPRQARRRRKEQQDDLWHRHREPF